MHYYYLIKLNKKFCDDPSSFYLKHEHTMRIEISNQLLNQVYLTTARL